MKELSIHISESNMNGFFLSLKKNSLLIYNRKSAEKETFYSAVSKEINKKDKLQVKVIWNNRSSILVPSVIFRIENLYNYIGAISSVRYSPQCIQHGEFVAVWNTDERMETFNKISEEFSIPIIHTHQRVEHIAATPDNATSYSLYDNLLYITQKRNGKLDNSFVAKVQNADDVLYYILNTAKKELKILTSLPENWMQVINNIL